MCFNPNDYMAHSPDKIKHLFYLADSGPNKTVVFRPHFYVEVRIDFNDVRTGFREIIGLNRALEFNSDNAEIVWAGNKIREIDPQKLTTLKPDSVLLDTIPSFVDTGFMKQMEDQFLQYLLRSIGVKIFRNFVLGTYSRPGESLEDFTRRCRELLDEPMRRELDSLHEVFTRRLEQIMQKYLQMADNGPLAEAQEGSQRRDAFYRCSERIARFFLHARPEPDAAMNSFHLSTENGELREQLASLEAEAYRAIVSLRESYDDQAGSIDEYLIHPNLKDIHFVRSCILWMPAQAT